eukprot:COSAG02_NODE_9225_length_2284_cov_1.831579_1_plen_63_part_10
MEEHLRIRTAQALEIATIRVSREMKHSELCFARCRSTAYCMAIKSRKLQSHFTVIFFAARLAR